MSRWVNQRRGRWYLKIFGERLHDLKVWSLTRRSVTAGFGAGIAIAFIPLPVHSVTAVLVALARRINVAATLFGTLVVNPLTIVPLYYLAYRVGAWLLRQPVQGFRFEMSWRWLENGLGPLWRPFLLGCLVCAVVGALAGRWLLEWLWRSLVSRKFRQRRRRLASP